MGKALGSLSVVFVVLSGLAFGSFGDSANAGTFTTLWSGSSGPGSTTVVSTPGTAGPAEFTYNYDPTPGVNGPGVLSQSWTFSTVADATGSVPLAYTYSGFHAFFQVTVGLKAFVTGPGGTIETPLVSAGPSDCNPGACNPPSNGFCYVGTQTLSVQAGDTYGFVMTGSNYDATDVLRGALAVEAGTSPTPCPPPPTTTTTSTTTTSTVPPTPPVSQVSIVQAVATGPGAANVSVEVSGAPSTAYTVNFSTASSCSVVGTPVGGPVLATTGPNGTIYITGPLTGLGAAIRATVGTTAACAPIQPDNDAWTRAFEIPLTGSGPLTGNSSGYIDAPGGTRWYKFAVQPGGTARVSLTDLPADYDLALFKDISTTFATLQSIPDLNRLSAEFAPSVFSPSVFSPSVFSPSVFSPEAFAPSVFSPSVFSPVGVAPSVFSPETFTSAQTRSLLVNSATAGTADETVVTNTWNNTGYFYVRVTGRNGAFSATSPFSVKVTRDDLPACAGVNQIAGTPSITPGAFQTVILWDSSRMPSGTAGNSAADITTLRSKLDLLKARPEVQGVVVDLAGDARVQALNAQADVKKGCPYAKNLVAAAIQDIVGTHRSANSGLKYVVIVGPDGAIPFFRYPDQALLGPEQDYVPPVSANSSSESSLRLNYVLGQDEYGASTTLGIGAGSFPIPDLAVGRLVETAAEASGMIDAYTPLIGGITGTPTRALVTGYDFLTDAADAVSGDLAAGIGSPAGPGNAVDTLVTANSVSPQDPRSWTADGLRAKLFGPRKNDLVFLAGHFSANSALAADFASTVLSTELANSTTDFTNSIVFSAGCHSGYNIDDTDAVPGVTATVDWTQAFARKKATLIAGTGYQYGDTDFLEYSERIYSGFAKQLRYGSGPVSVGQALVRAKQAYLKDTPDPRGLHQKALLISTLFGLPMLSVNMPQGRLQAPSDSSIISLTTPAINDTPGAQLGIVTATARIADPTTQVTKPLTDIGTNTVVNATYYTGPDGVVTNPAEPAIPLISKDVSVVGKVLRGVGFRGGPYADNSVLPLTGAATTEIRGVHAPFVSPVFFPMRLATVNYYDALSGGDTRLLVTPAQHRAIAGSTQSTLRLFSALDFQLFYSDNLGGPALSAAPSIGNVSGAVDGNDVVFRASVSGNPAAGVQQVWVTYTGDASRWASLDLVQCVRTPVQPTLPAACGSEESTTWIGRLPGAASGAAALRFMVQAANGVGLVTLDDNLGAYFSVPVPVAGQPPVAAPTNLVLDAVAAPVVYGWSIGATATLTSNGSPVAGRTVVFTLNAGGASAITDNTGKATVSLPVNLAPGAASLRATFAEVPGELLASAATQSLTVNKAATTLALELTTGPIGARATLKDAAGAPLGARTVYLTVTGTGAPTVRTAITDYLGRANFSPLSLAPGTYSLDAQFLGTVSGSTLTDPTYLGSSDVKPLTVIAVSNLGVSGSVQPTPPVRGLAITYTFVISNTGPDPAANVRLTDSLPPSLSSPATPTPGCSIAGSLLTCLFPTLANGGSQTVTVSGTPNVSGTLETSAVVSADGSDPQPTNNTAIVSVVVEDPTSAPTNLIVSGPTSVAAGSTYSATANADGAPAPTFSFESTPARPSWLQINAVTGIVSGAVPATGVASFSYRVRATNSRGFVVSPTVTVTVNPIADIRLDMLAPPLLVGLPSAYPIVVTNLSTVATSGVVTVTDTLPTGLVYTGFVGPGWNCAAVGQRVTCTLGRPLSGRSITALAISVRVTAANGTVITNTATVTPTDNAPSNNSATVRSTVRR